MRTISIQKDKSHRVVTRFRTVLKLHNWQLPQQQTIILRPSEKMDEMTKIAIERKKMCAAKKRNDDTSKVLLIKFQLANRIYSTTNWTGMKLIIR